MGMERGVVVEKLDGAWSCDQGTIGRSVERSKDQNWLEHGALRGNTAKCGALNQINHFLRCICLSGFVSKAKKNKRRERGKGDEKERDRY